jgi:CRP-like cAMP-binding protein
MDEAVLSALRSASLFQALTERQQQQLAGIAKTREFAPGEYLVREGETGALAMWVIVDGEVEVRARGVKVNLLTAGDHVGEMAVLSPSSRRTADLIAVTPVRAVQLTKWDLEPMVRANPDLAMTIIEVLAARLEEADARFVGSD